MDSTTQINSKFISFNCKSLKRSMECIKTLSQRADVLCLQETWLFSHDIPLLGCISDDFGYTGTSAMDTSAGPVRGRPYGGVAILWRKSVFRSVSLIKCESARLVAIKAEVNDNHSIVIMSVYMPVNHVDNLAEFTSCLGEMYAVIENSNVQSVFVLGDYNAHPYELFGTELLDFCSEQQLVCADVEKLGINSDSYTFISEAHGTRSWLDHLVVSQAAWKSIENVTIHNDIFWSDHFPIELECNLNVLKLKMTYSNKLCNKILWGVRDKEQIDMYYNYCNEKLRDVDFPAELSDCCDRLCNNHV
ncbi:hypothetical protein O0L34_g19090 [Tuta absoluta]|nr:hypothetical protein O0L34_g19090 [Tuta absoluta]